MTSAAANPMYGDDDDNEGAGGDGEVKEQQSAETKSKDNNRDVHPAHAHLDQMEASLGTDDKLHELTLAVNRVFADEIHELNKASTADGFLQTAMKKMIAQHSEAPSSYFQLLTMAAASDDDAIATTKAPLMFVGGVLMLVVQLIVAQGLAMGGSDRTTCINNNSCMKDSTFCEISPNKFCEFCGHAPFLPAETAGGTLNWPLDVEYIGFNITLVEEVCTPPYQARVRPDVLGTAGADTTMELSAATVANWCAACVGQSPENGETFVDDLD
eukprot:COSAG05_NODE_4359_length_1550_cov_2.457615_1_plen_270_part_10